jgi:hypothetical protein
VAVYGAMCNTVHSSGISRASLCAFRKTCTALCGSCIAGVTNPDSLLTHLKEGINYIPSLLEGDSLKNTRQHDL